LKNKINIGGEGRVKIKSLAGAVAASAVVFSVGAVAPASAADNQVFGIQQTVTDPNGGELAYTVTKLLPSGDAVPYPISGQLYEVTVRANAINGVTAPVIPSFSAQSESGQNYPALAGAWTPQGLSGAILLPGGSSTGKIYFDAVGDSPTSVVYNGPGGMLGWTEPPSASGEEAASDEGDSGGEASGEAPESESSDSGAADTSANADVAAPEEGE
jgi:hypothetical protein